MMIRPLADDSVSKRTNPEVGSVTTPARVSELPAVARLAMVVPLAMLMAFGIVMLVVLFRSFRTSAAQYFGISLRGSLRLVVGCGDAEQLEDLAMEGGQLRVE